MVVKITALVSAGAVFISSLALAQAPVIDLTANRENQESAQTNAVRNNYLEIQTLREEISALRGLVEEMNYELRKVRERQDEDYKDLDQRIVSASSGSVSNTINSNTGNDVTATAAAQDSNVALPISSQSDADNLYRQGFSALREGNRAESTRIFKELIEKYPGSTKDADAHYWLGETHWLNLEIEQSRQAFTKLFENYPNYRKMSEVRYRLGQIYAQLGDQEKALEFIGSSEDDQN